jgi:hypothetical protein
MGQKELEYKKWLFNFLKHLSDIKNSVPCHGKQIASPLETLFG